MTTVHHCVSLGSSCHAAEFLQAQDLRHYALPFDWMHTDAAMITACVADGCAELFDRRSLDSPVSVPSRRKPWRKRCLHRRFRTTAHVHIFQHHDLAQCDDDFAHHHRAADRLRRLLQPHDDRTLYFYLVTDASPGGEHSKAFVADAQGIYASLRRHSASPFSLCAVRAVPREAVEGAVTLPAGGREHTLLHEREDGDAELVVHELVSRTRTVVPFSRARPQGTIDELADVAAIRAAVDSRFQFELRDTPPPSTSATLGARAACSPRWVWAPRRGAPCGPRAHATVAELRDAIRALPVEPVTAAFADAGADDDVVEVAAWAELWANEGSPCVSVREWRAAAKELGVPSRRSASRADLVATVVGYHLAGERAPGRQY